MVTTALFGLLDWTSLAAQTKKPTAATATALVGRVLAYKDTLAFGAGLGPRYSVFVFGVRTRSQSSQVNPVKVAYAFSASEAPPPDSFFDYSKLYELQATREPKCDETVSSLSQEKNVDVTGKELPPTDVLHFVEGAPKIPLTPSLVLPCYIVYAGKYKVLGTTGTP